MQAYVCDIAHGEAGRKEERRFIDQYCMKCPVQDKCLQEGMLEPLGVWGGLLPHERYAIRTNARKVFAE